jgi:hypothetical protein
MTMVNNVSTLNLQIQEDPTPPAREPHFTKRLHSELAGVQSGFEQDFFDSLDKIKNPTDGDATNPINLSELSMSMGAYTLSITTTSTILSNINQANKDVISSSR